jgi:hypothetical protein
MIWSQSRNGTAIDLLDPRPEQVDFREIADTLAFINRYNGCTFQPVSVALHTLIVIDIAPDFAKPYAALHDAPEARLGDQSRPFIAALLAQIETIGGDEAARAAKLANDRLHKRHFHAIRQAAGLPPPTREIEAEVKRADDIALMTERKWFMAHPERTWDPHLEALVPQIPKTPYRWKAPDKCADALYERFLQLLPSLRKRAA